MADKKLKTKVANVPPAQPEFDALNMSAPVLVAMNPKGRWENCKPEKTEEEQLRAVVQHLVDSKAISAAQSFCGQCAQENQQTGGKSNYVPVIMMPIYPADQCPFDIECESQNIKESESKELKILKKKEDGKTMEKETGKKIKRRSFVLQRFTDFDLLSQW